MQTEEAKDERGHTKINKLNPKKMTKHHKNEMNNENF